MKGLWSTWGRTRPRARYTDSAAVAVLAGGLKFRVSGPDGAYVETDMPKGIGGDNSAGSPGWLMRAALASCLGALIVLRAAQQGIELGDLAVTVDSESDDRGILGMDASVPAGPSSARAQVRLTAAGASDAQLQELVSWAETHCPVADTVSRAIPLQVQLVSAP